MGVFDGWRHAKALVRSKERLSVALANHTKALNEGRHASAAVYAEHVANWYISIAEHLEVSWLARRTVKTGTQANARLSAAWWSARADELWKQAAAEMGA